MREKWNELAYHMVGVSGVVVMSTLQVLIRERETLLAKH